ncbi:MAG TPA: hypothetical protein VG942_07165 [Hyphomonadaceae bacterium]|nr:hypothetical protein [Hyphomonadaceae bacterium]
MKNLAFVSVSLLALAAIAGCSPKAADTAKPAAPAATASKTAGPACIKFTADQIDPKATAPDIDDAKSKGKPDPRLPSVDPASINDDSSPADIMHACVIPGSEILFAQESSDPPTTDAQWKTLQNAADAVIKGADLLKTSARSEGRQGWIEAANKVAAGAKVSYDKLMQKKADDLVFDDGDMMAGCTSCHQQFRDTKPPEGKLIDDKPATPAPAKPK